MQNRSFNSVFIFASILTLCSSLFWSTGSLAELRGKAKAADANQDGLLQKDEARGPAAANFEAIDCDKSGALDGKELYNFFRGSGECEGGAEKSAGNIIIHEKAYPSGPGPFPAVITLHTSGGLKGSKTLIQNFRSGTWVNAGYAVYAPNFFAKHGITTSTRMDTFDKYREDIEKELVAIIALMKADSKIDKKNIFAVGFSNGGFWASFLAGKANVNAAASHYGVWKGCFGRDCENPYPVEYFSSKSSPLLALHGDGDSTQKPRYFEAAWNRIDGTPKIERHIYEGAGHAWDCFPYFPKSLVAKNPGKFGRLLKKLKGVCANKFDGPNKAVTEDAFKRTLAFFKKHAK